MVVDQGEEPFDPKAELGGWPPRCSPSRAGYRSARSRRPSEAPSCVGLSEFEPESVLVERDGTGSVHRALDQPVPAGDPREALRVDLVSGQAGDRVDDPAAAARADSAQGPTGAEHPDGQVRMREPDPVLDRRRLPEAPIAPVVRLALVHGHRPGPSPTAGPGELSAQTWLVPLDSGGTPTRRTRAFRYPGACTAPATTACGPAWSRLPSTWECEPT